MGTRGTCGILYKDELKLGYNQFDSYPTGLGSSVVKIVTRINKENGWQKLKDNITRVKNVEEKDITPEIIERYAHYADLGVSEQKYEDPYCLFRRIQDTWINEVYEGNLEHYDLNRPDYIGEYCYLINLDDNVFEFYLGYGNNTNQINRFPENADATLYDVTPLSRINSKHVQKMEKCSQQDKINPSVATYLKKKERKSKLKQLDEKIKEKNVV